MRVTQGLVRRDSSSSRTGSIDTERRTRPGSCRRARTTRSDRQRTTRVLGQIERDVRLTRRRLGHVEPGPEVERVGGSNDSHVALLHDERGRPSTATATATESDGGRHGGTAERQACRLGCRRAGARRANRMDSECATEDLIGATTVGGRLHAVLVHLRPGARDQRCRVRSRPGARQHRRRGRGHRQAGVGRVGVTRGGRHRHSRRRERRHTGRGGEGDRERVAGHHLDVDRRRKLLHCRHASPGAIREEHIGLSLP